MIDINNLSVTSLQSLLELYFDKSYNFGNKKEEFYNLAIKKALQTINDISHQLFQQTYKTETFTLSILHFYTFRLWIGTFLSTDNSPRGSGKAAF